MGGEVGSLSGAWGWFGGGIVAFEKVLEGKPRLREAQRAVEELEGTLARMGIGDHGVKVKEAGDNNFQLVGVEWHPAGNPVVAEEAEGGGGQSLVGGMNPRLADHQVDAQEVGLKRASQSYHLPLDKGDGSSHTPSLDASNLPTPPSTPFGGCSNAPFGSTCTPRPTATVGGPGRMGMHQAGPS